MKTSETNSEIIKALVASQSEIQTVGKDRKNPFAGSDYATLDNILEEVKPILSKNGIFLTQEPLTLNNDNQVKIGVITRFFHTSGEFIEYDPLYMTLEKGSKMNMAQSAGSVITYAKRYSLSAALGIATGEDTDGIDTRNQHNNQQPRQQQPPQQQEKLATPKMIGDLKDSFYKYADKVAEVKGKEIAQKDRVATFTWGLEKFNLAGKEQLTETDVNNLTRFVGSLYDKLPQKQNEAN